MSDGTKRFHATREAAAIQKIYEELIGKIKTCMPVNGVAPRNFSVILFYDHDKQGYDIHSMNANEEEVKDLVMDAFEHLFQDKIEALTDMVEARRNTLN